jgi:hypothetical protein
VTTTAFNLAMLISNHDFHNAVRFSSRPLTETKSMAEPLTKEGINWIPHGNNNRVNVHWLAARVHS